MICMTKKVISAILALSMLFMTACGQSDSSDDIKETTSITTVEQAQTEDTSSDSEPAGTTEETTTTTASETSEKEEKTSSQTDRTEEKATTTTKTSEGNADTTTTTTPATTTTDASITRIAIRTTVPQTTTRQATTTTKATTKPATTTTTKATTKATTTTTKATTAKPSSEKIAFQKTIGYDVIIETETMYNQAASDANQIVAMVNNLRKSKGMNTVKVNPLLTKAAKIRARELAETYIKWGTLVTHTRPNGEGAPSVVDDVAGLEGYPMENALGSSDRWRNNTAKRLYTAWYNSEGHRANMLDKTHTIVGVAVCHVKIRSVYELGGKEFSFAIQLFE